MKSKLLGLTALVVAFGLSPASAETYYDYTVDFNIDASDVVTGSIETTCDNGCFLDSTNIVSWSFLLNGSNGISSSVGPFPNFALGNDQSVLQASSSGITFGPGGHATKGTDFANGTGPTYTELSFFDTPDDEDGVIVEVEYVIPSGTNPGYLCSSEGETSCSTTIPIATISSISSCQNVSCLSATPLPAALPLFACGLGALGLLGWRRKRKASAIAV
jgi:hypothetical protein